MQVSRQWSGDVPASGQVFRREGARGPVWYAKYRLPDGRQVQRRIGPAYTAGAARRPASTRSGPRRGGCATFSSRRTPGHCPDRPARA
jgi:hypothetical protein